MNFGTGKFACSRFKYRLKRDLGSLVMTGVGSYNVRMHLLTNGIQEKRIKEFAVLGLLVFVFKTVLTEIECLPKCIYRIYTYMGLYTCTYDSPD